MRKIIALLWFVFLVSCTRESDTPVATNGHHIPTSKGEWQNPDRFEKPILVPAGEPIPIPAGKPIASPNHRHHSLPCRPKVVAASEPLVCTPGKDHFLQPETLPAIGEIKLAGSPEVVVAKDMVSKDQNPANFRFFKVLQGLKHNGIRCLLQDRSGNIWLGTNGGGVSRYDGKSFAHFTSKEGLAHDVVYSILQDKNGNLWFGTHGGISCYDGKTFTNYIDKRGLANNIVLSMLQDNHGDLWFGTNGGVSRYNGKNFTWFTNKQGLADNAVFCMLQDKSGKLWFGTHEGVSRYDGGSFDNFTTGQGLADNIVNSMVQDRTGHLWFGTSHGTSCYDGQSFSNFTDEEGLASNVVTAMLQSADGLIWFGTQGGGISRYDGSSFDNFTDKEGLPNNLLWSILQDKTGDLWFGTDGGGVSLYDEKSFINFTDKEGVTNNVIWDVLEDKSGLLWFGTNGRGASQYDGDHFSYLTKSQGLANNIVLSLLQDSSGNIWFGTQGGGVSRYNGKSFTNFTEQHGLANNLVPAMLQDKAGRIWFATYGGGVSRYDGRSFTNFTDKQGLAGNFVSSMLLDDEGNLWFGTYGTGLSCYNGKSFTRFTEKEGLAGDIVSSILQDNDGILWFGTYSGVSRYDGKRFVNFTDKEGLANNAVLNIVQDKDGDLWFGTRKGLSKITRSHLTGLSNYLERHSDQQNLFEVTQPGADYFDPVKQALFYNYDYNDGFVGLNCRRNSVLQDSKGRIWWGADVLTCYNPNSERADTTAPVVQLNNVKLFGEDISWARLGAVTIDTSGRETVNGTARDTVLRNGVVLHDIRFDGISRWYPLPQHLSLPYNNNNLTFNFIGIHLQSRNHIKYQYTLQGLEDNWSVVTERNEAQYGNLPFGEYTFKVKAMNQSGVWSAPLEFSFEVRPPWWQTLWFKGSVLACIVLSIWAYIKWRERELKERQRELEMRINEATLEIKERHKEITDSINYAERIQRAFLATQEHLDQHLSEYFIFFRPKGIVSGDFYWSATLNNGHFAMACADSTGHGVPGAIMSLLNVSSLEKAVEVETEPHKILSFARKTIIDRLKRDGSTEGGKDGMDGSLLAFDFKNKILHCATANNPVCIIRGTELIEIKPDHLPVGKHERDNEPYTLHTLQLQKGDLVYAFTDGFSDQFGGPSGKKFKYKKLLELLLTMASESMATQKQKLSAVFEEWKGNLEQVDDVTVIGVRI